MAKKRQVRAPDSISVVRQRSGQFIGDNDNPNHLVHECVDNFLDEIRNGFGNSALLNIDNEKGIITVADNGRGMPIGKSKIDETGQEVDTLELLFTKLYSGTKFSFDDDELETLFGQNGVGLITVNALSEWVNVKTKHHDKTKMWVYKFVDGKLESKTEIDKQPADTWSTVIQFKPSLEYFQSTDVSIEIFLDRLRLSQAKIPSATFIFNNNPIEKLTLEKYVKEKLKISEKTPLYSADLTATMMVDDKATKKKFEKSASITVFLTYEAGDSISIGDVNLRSCDGTFITNLQTQIKNILPSKLDKKYTNVPDRFLLEGLRLYASLTIPHPRFDSQSKVRMVTPVKKELIDTLDTKMNKILNMDHIKSVISEILDRKITSEVKSKSSKIRASNKLIDCVNTPGKVLYIVEGDSANAAISDARDKYWEASLPLRGKVINVEKQSIDKIMKNKEIKDITEAIGNKDKYRYDKITIVCDADSDGHHIVVLLILILCKYFEDLIREKRISILLPPLYAATKNKKFIPLYKIEETEVYKKQGYTIRRFKGLGEMKPDQMEEVLKTGLQYTLEIPKNKKRIDQLIKVITDTDEKRKYMGMEEQFNFSSFIEEILLEKSTTSEGDNK